MKIKLLLLAVSVLFAVNRGFADDVSVKGKALDSATKAPLIGATVVLYGKGNEVKYHDISGNKGDFEMKGVAAGSYTLKITYISYKAFEKKVTVKGDKDVNLGNLSVVPTELQTKEVEVTGQAPIGEEKGDTTEFNSKSMKTQPNATAEDLLKKVPGVQVDNSGNVQAQGESVKKMLVDGKPFFGDDPTLTMRNLPADIVDKVQIYDQASDQSQFTGFDDGQSQKTINFITKATKRHGEFGKFSGGYGDQGKYIGSLNMNLFNDAQRISLLGLTNNINQQNFSVMDILNVLSNSNGRGGQFFSMMSSRVGSSGGNMRMGPPGGASAGGGGPMGGMSNYMVGQQDGLSTTHAFGGNYSDSWADGLDVSGSYFYNYTKNGNQQDVLRNYLLNADSTQNYIQNNSLMSKNINHRFNMRLNWQIDSSNSVLLVPNLTVQANNAGSDYLSQNFMNQTSLLNSTNSNYGSNYSGMNFSNQLLLRHRFQTPGRTISLSVNTSYNNKTGAGDQYAMNEFYQQSIIMYDSLNQQTATPNSGYGLSGNAVYTEPINDNQQLLANYTLSYNKNNSDKRTWNYNYTVMSYDVLDSLLSNVFANDYLTQRGGVGYRYKDDDINFSTIINYQRTALQNNQDFPASYSMNHVFENVLPSLRFSYKFTKRMNINLNYRTSTDVPSVTQLQNVVDNSNPLQLTTGNTDLKQQYTHSIFGRFANFGSDFSTIFFAFAAFNYRTNYIANSTFLTSRDTVVQGNILLPAGGQITKPVNMDGYWSFTSFLTYGFPFSLIQSNINLNAGGIFTRTPSLVNKIVNYSNAYNLNIIFTLASNISENLDFTLSSRANMNITRNTLQTNQNNKYNIFMNSLGLDWIFWEGFFLHADMTNQYYTGLVQGNNQNFTLLNLALGKKFFSDNSGEVKLSVFDALKQNKSIQTNVTDYYIEYITNSVLKQYVMLTFTYNLKKFDFSR
jgi:hypothetical protein